MELKVGEELDKIDNTAHGPSRHIFKFDDGCPAWSNNRDYNTYYLMHMQNYFNDLLRAKGYLLVNDVCEMLGIPPFEEYHGVGWTIDGSFVDLGIFNERNNNDENVFILDPNVDGYILDKI